MTPAERKVIKKLVTYLPRFDNEPCVEETGNWWPTYTPFVEKFFTLAYSEFVDNDYAMQDISELEAKLKDDAYIKKATVDQCRTLLTLINCGEKFCDGYRRSQIERGRVQAVLRRLAELEKEG